MFAAQRCRRPRKSVWRDEPQKQERAGRGNAANESELRSCSLSMMCSPKKAAVEGDRCSKLILVISSQCVWNRVVDSIQFCQPYLK